MNFCLPAYSFTLSNFEVPESILVDPDDGAYYVSNINGAPMDKDGNGYISKINKKGNIVIQKFIGGQKDKGEVLDAPKGMAVIGKDLFVTDIDKVKRFDKKTGKLVSTIDFSKFSARFLNDITADPQGALYVSDMMTNRIFKVRLPQSEISVYKEDKELSGPNGLLINPKTKNLIVVTWQPGKILEIDRSSGRIHVLKKAMMSLDGVDADGEGNLYVSSFERGEIYKISNYGRGALMTFMSGLTTPADISFDRKRNELLIPSFKGNTATSVVAPK